MKIEDLPKYLYSTIHNYKIKRLTVKKRHKDHILKLLIKTFSHQDILLMKLV